MQQPLKVVGKVALVIVAVIALHVLKRVIVLSNSPCKGMDTVAQAEDPICLAYTVSIQSNLSIANIVIGIIALVLVYKLFFFKPLKTPQSPGLQTKNS